ncbi:MAG TPA: serine/threonine-protein kinase [Terriglobales bacterium]
MKAGEWQRAKPLLEAAIALDAAERSSFLDRMCAGDPGLRAELDSLLASHEQIATSFLKEPAVKLKPTPAPPPARAGRKIGAYEIVEEIGHGGMGEVYRAFRADGQYSKVAAVKMVRGGAGSSAVEERFRNERQILASLDHPNIARLLDGGTTEDGVPYLVMELVAGERIDVYCDERKLPIAERLQLFRQVCAAVQYAHQRLVIHRDLKPSNILVTNDCVPKLLDFGIAKILDPALGAEATLLRPMTPEYASPEQVRGEAITTATDIYSLGVVFYQLLTGNSPYRGDTHGSLELARAVCEAEPERPSLRVMKSHPADGPLRTPGDISALRDASPSKLSRRLRGDLDNIALTALRKEPQHRYASAEQFAEDVRRHLEGLPVTATRGSWRYRTGKFIKRHKVGMTAAAAVFFALMVGAGATLRGARVARQQALIAEGERARAERRFQDVRKLANSLIFELHDSIQDLPGSTPARKLIVERALEYLDSLAQESREDVSLQRELADAYQRIGNVQGGPFGPNVGDTVLAIKSYEKALRIRQALLVADARDIQDSIRFAETSRLLANALSVNGNISDALIHSRRAVAVLEALLPLHSQDWRLLAELTRDYNAEGDIRASSLSISNLRDVTGALPLRQRQLATAQQLNQLLPNDPESQRALGSSLSAMGDQLLLTGQRREALEHYLRAQRIFHPLAATSNTTKGFLDLHDTYYRLSPAQLANGELEQALVSARGALDIAKKLRSADPQNTLASLLASADYANFADVSSRLERRGDAYSALSHAFAIDAELGRLHPGTREFRHMRAQRLQIAGDVSRRFKDYSQALRYYRQDAALLLEMQKEDPANDGLNLLLALAYNGMAEAQDGMRHPEAAAESYQQALRAVSSNLALPTPSGDVIYAAATAYAGLAEVEANLAAAATGDPTRRKAHLRHSLSWYDLGLKTWRQTPEPGLVSPSGYDCIPLSAVIDERAKAAAAIKRD